MKTNTTLKTKAMSILLCLALCFSMLPMSISAADNSTAFTITGGVEGTDYTYANDVLDIKAAGTYEIANVDPTTSIGDVIKVSASSGDVKITLSGVNILADNVSPISISGNCNTTIKLADNSQNTLTVERINSYDPNAGLHSGTNPLTITCDSAENIGHICNSKCGTLTIQNGRTSTAAAIGGNRDESGSNITINGGNIKTNTYFGAGIGSGLNSKGTSVGSYITINGGIVDVSSAFGAGIGGGESCDGTNITINGGTVKAWSSSAAGIGGGQSGDGKNIEINGGTVTAQGNTHGAGIGGGQSGTADNIKISGGNITATSLTGAGIGGGQNQPAGTVTISGGTVLATSTTGKGIGDTVIIQPKEYEQIAAYNARANTGTALEGSPFGYAENGHDVSALILNQKNFYSEAKHSHTDSNKDHVCDNRCGESIGVHTDTNKDHICDYGCTVTIGTCEDADKDHDCDYGCDKTFGTHEDADTDHICDYGCDKTLGTCEDADKDHNCDYGCDKIFGTHEDSDTNHICDYECAVTIGTCEDVDKDHNCDYGCDKAYGTHEDSDTDHACDYGCAVTIGTCEDADKDHDCDYGCDKTFGTCEDADKDHDCDYGCDKRYGTCEDVDKDHNCDYGCGKTFGTHEDSDTNHICDYECAVAIGTCEDADKNHDCDYGCDKTYGTHEDTDTDHDCDYGCNVAIGACEDTDKDHDCDYGCNKTFGTHEQASGKHTCYYCGETMTTCKNFDEIVKPEVLKSAADCTNPAVYYKSCTVCGANGTETFTSGEAKGHSYTAYVSDNNATCETDGTKTAKCDNCEATDTVADTGSKKAHTYEKGKCTVCDEINPDYEEITNAPQIVDNKPSNNPQTDDNKTPTKSPQTGHNRNIALWFTLLFISGGMAIGLNVNNRKRIKL